ncbi:reverse transcriptase [Elysia marginata]|uniref:Reverse transcriptase n=1 Tax=Elysia marginata TaxID=1093978 RepID=A0AAV4FJI5_9GAST|nr:reverse transcriptase [Elysia marginata]
MAEVNINNPGGENHVGDISLEGFNNPKIHSFVKHGPKNLIGTVYPGETLQFLTVVETNSSIDLKIWKRSISRGVCQANIHIPNADALHTLDKDVDSMYPDNNDQLQDQTEKKLVCPVVVTYKGSSSKSNQCVSDLDLDLNLDSCDFKKVIKSIVHENQSGFISGRKICSHIRLLDDITKYADTENAEGLVVSVDYKKAFDSVHKEAILAALKKFNFGPNFTKYIETILSNTESAIKNGEVAVFDSHSKKIVPLAESEIFYDDSDQEEIEAASHKLDEEWKTQQTGLSLAQPNKTRIPVAHSEFFDVVSDEEETEAGGYKLASKGMLNKDETVIPSVLPDSSRHQKSSEVKENLAKVSSSSCSLQEKKVIKTLQVQKPPDLQVRHSMAGQKQLVILTVSNNAEKQMVIKSIHMLCSPPPLHGNNVAYEQG